MLSDGVPPESVRATPTLCCETSVGVISPLHTPSASTHADDVSSDSVSPPPTICIGYRYTVYGIHHNKSPTVDGESPAPHKAG